MAEKLKVGLVGCVSGRGRDHVRSIAGSRELEIFSMCDIDEAAVSAMASEIGATHTTDYDEFLKSGGFDIVDIVTPAFLHHPMTVKALKGGYHVMVEKPMADTIMQAEEMIKTAAANRVKLAMISQRRFSWTLQTLKKILDEEKVGRLLHTEINLKFYRENEYYTSAPMRGEGNGVLAIQGSHALDWICWLFGAVDYVYTHNDTLFHEVKNEDFSASILKHKSGMVLRLDASHCTYPSEQLVIKIWGEHGSIEALFGKNITVVLKDAKEHEVLPQSTSTADTTRLQLDDFARAIRTDSAPFVCGKDGLAVIRLMTAMYESAKTGARVNV